MDHHAPADGPTASPPVSAQLRHKMLSRAATFAEGVRPTSPKVPGRRSSLLSNLSDSQHGLRPSSSTESLRRSYKSSGAAPLPTSDESSWWHSSPVLVAIVPAAAALTHPNGGTFATDVVLLLLGAWFMHKCISVPWQWYFDAQQRQYMEVGEPAWYDTIREEDEAHDESTTGSPDPDSAPETRQEPTRPVQASPPLDATREAARAALRRTEMISFGLCFIGPVLGAYLLHQLRSQFTHTSQENIVTDLHLTIYVLAAEMLPILRLIEMNKERTLHLQRIVGAESLGQPMSKDLRGLSHRLASLEARVDGSAHNSTVDIGRISIEVRQSMQRQLDDLNRAVRRFEKKSMATSIQTEARFQEIDMRMNDTLSLAAAAARTGQRPGLVASAVTWIAGILAHSIQMGWDIAMYPFTVANSIAAALKSAYYKDDRALRKRSKVQTNGYSSMTGTPRIQSRNGR